MTKTELMETYTAEQLAEMVINYSTACFQSNVFNSLKNEIESPLKKSIEDSYKTQIKQKEEKIYKLEKECEELQSEVGKCRKAFEDAKKECNCRIEGYQKKIDKLYKSFLTLEENFVRMPENKNAVQYISDFLQTEPIKVADILINAEGEYEHNPITKKICGNDKGTYRIFDVSELRQIAEHLLVYCNYNGEVGE